MQTIFGLFNNHGLRAVQDLGRNFLSPVGRQAMQHNRRRFGSFEESFIELVWSEGLHSFALFVLFAHTGPDVSIQDVGLLNRLCRVVGHDEGGPRLLGVFLASFNGPRVRWVVRMTADGDVHPDLRTGFNQGIRHVISIAEVRECETF